MRSIAQCLNPHIAKICYQAMHLEKLNDLVQAYLPADLKPYCQVSSFNKGVLHLSTPDPVWAMQLRYSLPELRDKLRGQGGLYTLASIAVAISHQQPTALSPKTKPPLSENAQSVIQKAHDTCLYKPLKEIWKNLLNE